EITASSSRGSNAILAMMRSQIGIDRPDPESPWRRVRVLKGNLGLAPKPVGFQVTNHGLEFGDAPQRPKKETRKQDAMDWLKSYMEPGKWYLRDDVQAAGKRFGFSDGAIQRAREELGITTEMGTISSRDNEAMYEWRLPTPGE